ncbi:MAG TPA: hypothetical protein VH575_16595 [Gemmataceae bacterium]|jgi:hypothetical protein
MLDPPLAAQSVSALLEAMDNWEECLGCLYWLRDHLEELEMRVDEFAAQMRLKQPGGSTLPK